MNQEPTRLGYTTLLVCADSQVIAFIVREDAQTWEGLRMTKDGYSREVTKYNKSIWSRATP